MRADGHRIPHMRIFMRSLICGFYIYNIINKSIEL
jgi:hypothetical protein